MRSHNRKTPALQDLDLNPGRKSAKGREQPSDPGTKRRICTTRASPEAKGWGVNAATGATDTYWYMRESRKDMRILIFVNKL